VGIRNRDGMQDWRPQDDREPDGQPAPKRWTPQRVMACVAIVVFIVCLVPIAVLT
jgi:hypothetical protein